MKFNHFIFIFISSFNNFFYAFFSESFLKRFFLQLLIRSFYVFFFLGLLYIVDVEKFSQLKNGAEALVNKTVSFLPEGVVTQGKEIIEYTRPAAEFTINKMRFALNETSNFLNTSPIFKEHWMNVKEISSISSAHMVDYIRTLYLQITGICQGAKNKLF